MNTLVVTDLDGTFLHTDGKVSEYSVEIVNKLIDAGVNFTCATARTSATTLKVLDKLTLNIPIVLMNGAVKYDPKAAKFIEQHNLTLEQSQAILKTFEECNYTPAFVYSIIDGEFYCFTLPDEKLNPEMLNFKDERVRDYDKKFTMVKTYDEVRDIEIISFTLLGDYEELYSLREKLREIPGADYLLYQDVYSQDWLLEIHKANMNKGLACTELKAELEADRLIVFADNTNDLPMLRIADYSYAVANSKDNVKDLASEIIASNDDDAVANKLLELFEMGELSSNAKIDISKNI